MFKVNRLTSVEQSVENCFNLICWLKVNHDQLQATYKMTLFYQNNDVDDNDDGDDDDDDDNHDVELILWIGWPTKDVKPCFQLEPLSEILTIKNLHHIANRIWIYAEPEFRLFWRELSSSDNHYTTALQLSEQICPKRVFPVENGKSEHHYWILNIRMSELNWIESLYWQKIHPVYLVHVIFVSA